jgi:hypothetical protein
MRVTRQLESVLNCVTPAVLLFAFGFGRLPGVQGQDWDFIAHTFWLKHGVAMLFDSLYLAEGITLAYNSGEGGGCRRACGCVGC